MGADYTEYNNWYNYMSSIIRQIRGMQTTTLSSYRPAAKNTQEDVSFADVLENTASEVKVPESMDAIFEEAAEKYGVPAALLKAMGKVESDFNADAVSSAGAQGVMQLMPATARALGVKDPFDARSNIMGGAKYISQKLKKYNGDIDLALAAYNAGSGNVKKYGGVPPFKETRNYISRIRKYMQSDIRIGKTVQTARSQGAAAYRSAENTSAVYGQQEAMNMIELMKLQMQSRMAASGQLLQNDGIRFL